MIDANIHTLLETVLPDYCDTASIIKLEMTCKRYRKPEQFWLDRLKRKYQLELPENAKAKEYAILIETMYEFDEQSLSRYLRYLAKTASDQKESLYGFIYWDHTGKDKGNGKQLIRANNNYEAMSKFFTSCSYYIYQSYQHCLNIPQYADECKDLINGIKEKPISNYLTYYYRGEIHIRFISLADLYQKVWNEIFDCSDNEINLIKFETIL